MSPRTTMVAVNVSAESCGSLFKTFTVAVKVVSDVKDVPSKVRLMSPESPAAIVAGAVAESQVVAIF